ncbi:hypothetical protein Spb1_37670 [Planctopirus ephydatiae]|uniref:Uncharacterized protein n=1 Tax=Planctopirus ephydatiae TaxID=2528019 RepID=A0A518GTB7_9PLAN|nr:hypothetical protein [Planctopirus ephydatiae]QDV31822.1 hypothetical protein Spb1_37670 [Planctopirus ephydatiae]
MKDLRHLIPEWVTRGKTIRQLIQELQSFENQDMMVRMSLDDGESHFGISIIGKIDGQCVLINCEHYHRNEWQGFMEEQIPSDA